jgi:hypothetical protein
MSHGIDDFSVGERVLFVKQQVLDLDGNLNPAWGDGVVSSIDRATETIELKVRTLVPGWFDRVVKRPDELQKVPARQTPPAAG